MIILEGNHSHNRKVIDFLLTIFMFKQWDTIYVWKVIKLISNNIIFLRMNSTLSQLSPIIT